MLINAFRAALTTWGVAMVANKASLSNEVSSYLDDYSFKQGGSSIYNAPQIFGVDCVENANFVIKVYLKKGKRFSENKKILAKAQIRGRSIMVNMQNHTMLYDQKLFEVKSGPSYNLVPIFAHELGHCFGLTHSKTDKGIMASTVAKIARFPNSNDGKEFANILSVALQGGAPGYFNPTECVGLTAEP